MDFLHGSSEYPPVPSAGSQGGGFQFGLCFEEVEKLIFFLFFFFSF